MANNFWNSAAYFQTLPTANSYSQNDFNSWASWNAADPRCPISRFPTPLYPNALALGSQGIRGTGSRRRRNLFNPTQVQILKEAFEKETYVKPEHREMLAKRTGLTPQQVKIWFQNNRYKCKQKDKEQERSGTRCDREQKFGSDSPSSSGNDTSMRSNNSPEEADVANLSMGVKVEDLHVENQDIKDLQQQYPAFNHYPYNMSQMGAMQPSFNPYFAASYYQPQYPPFPTAP
uniref:Homeobox domain-containing protein n=1 Tax=Panagrolaimus sp. JU765 TaxID=591449 RepID=A0AC34QAY7_9BILA